MTSQALCRALEFVIANCGLEFAISPAEVGKLMLTFGGGAGLMPMTITRCGFAVVAVVPEEVSATWSRVAGRGHGE